MNRAKNGSVPRYGDADYETSYQKLRSDLKKLKAINRQLLEALKLTAEILEDETGFSKQRLAPITTAIAKAEKELKR